MSTIMYGTARDEEYVELLGKRSKAERRAKIKKVFRKVGRAFTAAATGGASEVARATAKVLKSKGKKGKIGRAFATGGISAIVERVRAHKAKKRMTPVRQAIQAAISQVPAPSGAVSVPMEPAVEPVLTQDVIQTDTDYGEPEPAAIEPVDTEEVIQDEEDQQSGDEGE
jgi:hypothetical protein